MQRVSRFTGSVLLPLLMAAMLLKFFSVESWDTQETLLRSFSTHIKTTGEIFTQEWNSEVYSRRVPLYTPLLAAWSFVFDGNSAAVSAFSARSFQFFLMLIFLGLLKGFTGEKISNVVSFLFLSPLLLLQSFLTSERLLDALLMLIPLSVFSSEASAQNFKMPPKQLAIAGLGLGASTLFSGTFALHVILVSALFFVVVQRPKNFFKDFLCFVGPTTLVAIVFCLSSLFLFQSETGLPFVSHFVRYEILNFAAEWHRDLSPFWMYPLAAWVGFAALVSSFLYGMRKSEDRKTVFNSFHFWALITSFFFIAGRSLFDPLVESRYLPALSLLLIPYVEQLKKQGLPFKLQLWSRLDLWFFIAFGTLLFLTPTAPVPRLFVGGLQKYFEVATVAMSKTHFVFFLALCSLITFVLFLPKFMRTKGLYLTALFSNVVAVSIVMADVISPHTAGHNLSLKKAVRTLYTSCLNETTIGTLGLMSPAVDLALQNFRVMHYGVGDDRAFEHRCLLTKNEFKDECLTGTYHDVFDVDDIFSVCTRSH